MTHLLRYPDLVSGGIVNNRTTLARWIKTLSFPTPYKLGPNSVAWDAREVEAWVDSRKVIEGEYAA